MIVAGGTGDPLVYEFLGSPRIGEKVVIRVDGGNKAFHVTEVTHYATGADGGAQTLLAVDSTGLP
jgi:hypothetical protein